MGEKKIVAISLDPDGLDDEMELCSYDKDGNLKKLDNLKVPESHSKLLSRFLSTDLPYIKYQEVNPFDLFDSDIKTTKTRLFKPSDAMLERDTDIINSMGIKKRKKENIDFVRENFYLPGLPNLISDEYPLFKPDTTNSHEYTNKEYYKKYVKPFQTALMEAANKKKFKIEPELITKLKDIVLFQSPVGYENYFSCDPHEFQHVFMDNALEWIIDIYGEFLYSESELKKFFKKTDKSYHPSLCKEPFQSLKPLGSVGHSSYPLAIMDRETILLNLMLVHLEIVNLSLGIGEGYELYFNSKKKNFTDEKITGAESTKINNFIKRFSRAVSICLNSKINRFIMTDYYWVGVFEIEDVADGEVEDAKRLISNVNVRHFAYYNFEDEKRLTVRNVIASFFYLEPREFLKNQEHITSLNNKIVKEWIAFNKTDNNVLVQRPSKRVKRSPYNYRTIDGISFRKQHVDLDKSLVEFVAIGMKWSCQTLVVDTRSLFLDKAHLSELKFKNSHCLLSIYDEYYQYPDLVLTDRHIGITASKFSNPEIIENANAVFKKWETSIKSYLKAKRLQGDVLVRVVDYGYLEDKPYNGKELHLKSDGYYILFDPVTDNEKLEDIDVTSDKHYELTKAALQKLHSSGVVFHPETEPIKDIFKFYNNKVYIINLEDTSISATNTSIKKDLTALDRIFSKKSDLSYLNTTRKSSTSHKKSKIPKDILESVRAFAAGYYNDDNAFVESDVEDEF